MPKYKNDPANTDYNAGDSFNYEVWTAETEIMLCNVPWDATYKDVVHFPTTTDLNNYLNVGSDITRLTNASYARIDEPIRIDMPFTRASLYNYIRVYNPSQPVRGNDMSKYYYYFIRGTRHVSPQCTELIVQLDVWQTFIRQVQFGRAYIESGHIGIANENNFRNYGRDFLTVPDGLDTGAEYVNVATATRKVMSSNAAQVNAGNGFSILAISTVDLHGDHGTPERPKQPSARGGAFQGMPSGASGYIWETASEFVAFLADYSSKPWVTSGITSVTLIPDVKRYVPSLSALGTKNSATRSYQSNFYPSAMRRDMMNDWRNSDAILGYIPARYRHLKKFLTSPYCMLELTVNAGSTIVMKPESWNSKNAALVEMLSIMPPNQRLAFVPMSYNGRNAAPEGSNTSFGTSYNLIPKDGDFMDMALFLSAFPTVPIVNNGQLQYLASNARSIASQYSSLNWAQQRSLSGNQLSYDQANAGINAGINQTNNAIAGDMTQTGIANDLAANQAVFNLFSGTAQGAGMGAFAGPMGAAAGGASGLAGGVAGIMSNGMQIDAANKALAARTNTTISGANISRDLGNYMKDTNKSYADWAAKGDYANNRAALDAKIQDTALIPHGVSGQFGGETFNMALDQVDLTLRFKMIDQAALAVIGEHWLRFGYPVHRTSFIPNDLRVMSKFSYWKLNEVYIRRGDMPETFKQTIRGILEKGVTVWDDARDIGVIDFANNQPLPDITLEGYQPPDWEPEPEPEPPIKERKRRKNMIVYATNDGGMKYALAGTSPGTPGNFIITDSQTLATSWLEFYGASEPVLLDINTFYEYEVMYKSPVSTLEYVEGP